MSDTILIKTENQLPITPHKSSLVTQHTMKLQEKESNKYTAQDLSNNEMDTKKDVYTSTTNYSNDARNNDKYEKPTSDSTTQQRFTSNPANNERTPQDSRNCIVHNISNNPTDAVMLERICASPNVTQINPHQSCTTKVRPQCELWKKRHPWVQYWPP